MSIASSMNISKVKVHIATIVTIMLCFSCGGGGSDDDGVSSTLPVNGAITTDDYQQVITPNSITAFDHQLKIGQSVDLFLYFPYDELSNIEWLQTSGVSVDLLSHTTKAIAFTPQSPGDYSFSASFTLNGQQQTLHTSFTVSNEVAVISTRLGHVVQSGNKVSLRTEIIGNVLSNTEQESLTWQQLSGPVISFDAPDNTYNISSSSIETLANINELQGNLVIFFNAPEVSEDTLIEFEVSAQYLNSTVSDRVAILVEASEPIANNAYFDERVATVYPYISNSLYAESIVDCVYSNIITSSCTLGTLPLLAQENSHLTIDNIMDRVVVSHPWMGERFQRFLINNDPNDDFKNLLRATTAIVISYDIRPSFYWAATGAIYLDANNLWVTQEERDTLNEAADYRSNFGDDLQFVMPWRYIKNNEYAYTSINDDLRTDRGENDNVYRFSSLLYHELAHANDFFPSTSWFSFADGTRILDAALDTTWGSTSLNNSLPLNSGEMKSLAQVSFAGATASSTQKNYQPTDIEAFYTLDNANGYYSYSSIREDYAMLFEELMMQHRFGVQRDIAITNNPSSETATSADYIVSWGQRGRIAEENIKPRVNFVLQRVLPELNTTTALAQLLEPILMRTGEDWIENLQLTSSLGGVKSSAIGSKVTTSSHSIPKINFVPYYHKELPKH